MGITRHGASGPVASANAEGPRLPVEAVFVLAEAWAEGTDGPTPCDPHLWAKRSDPDDPCHHAAATIRVRVPPSLAGVLTEPARVDAMFRNITRGTRRSSASSGTSRPLASCPA